MKSDWVNYLPGNRRDKVMLRSIIEEAIDDKVDFTKYRTVEVDLDKAFMRSNLSFFSAYIACERISGNGLIYIWEGNNPRCGFYVLTTLKFIKSCMEEKKYDKAGAESYKIYQSIIEQIALIETAYKQ